MKSEADAICELIESIRRKRMVIRRFTRAEIRGATDLYARTVYGHTRWIQQELVRAGFDITRTITIDTDPLGEWVEYRQEQEIPDSPGPSSAVDRSMPPEKSSGRTPNGDGVPVLMLVAGLAVAILALAWYASRAWYGIETLFP